MPRLPPGFVTNPISFLSLRRNPLHQPIRRVFSMTAATIPKIGTHDGTFHCDEALACHMLRTLPAYATSPIVRTRDPALLSSLDIVVDVGGEYNPSNHRYDHHQRSFQTTFASEGARSSIKLSSAGLVYKHFGREVLRAVLSRHSIQVEEQDIDKLYLKVYDSFVQAVDAVDNGVSRFESDKPARYESSTDLSSRVSRLNADWWEKKPDQDANFLKAVVLTGTEFDDCIVSTAKSWLPARTIVATAMSQRTEHDSAGRLLVMTEWAPWKDHLYNIENEQGQPGSVMYVIYQDMTRISWRVQCVPVEKDSFKSRRPLPEPWRGFRDAELDNLTGIDGCVFVHAAGFIGGNKTFEGALQMAHKALEGES